MLRDHGQSRKYYHDVEGYNGRLDAIQAGILTVKLKHLPKWNGARRDAASRYRQLFRGITSNVILPFESENTHAVYHLFVVRVQERDNLMKHLADAAIGTAIHYPIPLHLQKAYRHLGLRKGSYPVTEKVAPEILSLPMFPSLKADEQNKVFTEIAGLVAAEQRAHVAAT